MYYFKTSWRTLAKNKDFNTLNILGMAVGMAGFAAGGKKIYQTGALMPTYLFLAARC
jgi:hypothetical protein